MDKGPPESDEIPSDTPGSIHSDCSLEMSPATDRVPSKQPKKRQEVSAKSFANAISSRPTATVSPSMVKESRSKEIDHGGAAAKIQRYHSNSKQDNMGLLSMSSKHEDVAKLTTCYDESRRASLPLLSSMMLSGGSGYDSSKLPNLENTTLSSYVKLLSLDMPPNAAPSSQFHGPSPLSGLSAAAAAATTNQMTGSSHMIPGTGHMITSNGATNSTSMMGGRGNKPPAGDYHQSPSRTSLSMAAPPPAFLIPSPSPGGILTLHDPRPMPGIVDMIPPSFSPGLPGGPSSVAAAGLGPNFFPHPPPPATSRGHTRRAEKRPRLDLIADSPSTTDENEYSMQDTAFPSDNGHGGEKMEKDDLDIKPGYSFTGGSLGGGMGGDGVGGGSSVSQHLKWQAHMVNSWSGLCDGALQDIPTVGFQVETDKGFNFSIVDDAFVCQKKNHFQVTVTIAFPAVPKFVKLTDGAIEPIERFSIHLHGVKFEQINSDIKLEQSKSDRTKTKFDPETVEIPNEPGETIKRTMCRLHFSETTHNNMRKRGKPNPDQKYFSLVVSLHADTTEDSYTVVSHVSERIIVRASNPGNFDNDCDYSWFKSSNPDHIYHQGRVGINTDKPEQALSVHGNIQVTGQVLQASDMRIKRNIQKILPCQAKQHLDNISRLQLYQYQLIGTKTQDTACNSKNITCNSSAVKETQDTTCNTASNIATTCNTLGTVTGSKCASMQHVVENHKAAETDRGYESFSEDDCKLPHNSAEMDSTLCHHHRHCHATKTNHHGNPLHGDNGVKNSHHGVDREGKEGERKIVGLLAQEVRDVLPDAVIETKQEVQLTTGKVNNLLVVDKDQILMELLGAVQELKGVTEEHENKIGSSHAISLPSKCGTVLDIHMEKKGKCFTDQRIGLRINVQASLPQLLLIILAIALLIIFVVLC